MAERENIKSITIEYEDGEPVCFTTPDGWIRVRSGQISLSDKRIKNTYEVHWTEIEDEPT